MRYAAGERDTGTSAVRSKGWELSGEIELAAEVVPFATLAISTYGTAVLAKAWDNVADASIKGGLRLLQRIFGHQKDDEPLPTVVAEVVDYPDDEDMVVQLRLAIRRALQADPALAQEVAAIVQETTPSTPVSQHIVAGRDAYAAGRDMTVNRRPD